MIQNKVVLFLIAGLILLTGVGCSGETTVSPPVPTTNVVAPLATNVPATAVALATAVPTAIPPTAIPLTATAVPALVAGDARAEILAAYEKSASQPYRTDSLIRASNGDITLVGEMLPPDSLHTIMTSADFTMEMIIIGAEGWQAINGDWHTLPVETVQMVAATAFPAATLAQLEATLVNAQALGQQELDGRLMNVYQFESVLEGVTSLSTVYIDAETGLPMQQEIIGDAAGVTSNTTQKISYPAITISPPTP
jgi:hypothetical protein